MDNSKKITGRVIINTGVYMHIEFDISVDIPVGLKNKDLVKYLHKEYFGMLTEARLNSEKRSRELDMKDDARLTLINEHEEE